MKQRTVASVRKTKTNIQKYLLFFDMGY